MTATLSARQIQLGTISLEIPIPLGYAELTPDMNPAYELQKQASPDVNQQFMALLPESQIAVAKQGQMPGLNRILTVQVNKPFISRLLTTQQFNSIKQELKTDLGQVFKKAQKEIDEQTDKISKKLSEKSGKEMAVSMAATNIQPSHLETDRYIAYSVVVDGITKAGSTDTGNFKSAVTTGVVHARGRVVFLYTTGGESDLEWTRQTNKQWAEAVIASNPSDETTAKAEAVSSGIDWGKIVNSSAIGAIVGAVIGLASFLYRRFKGDAKPAR